MAFLSSAKVQTGSAVRATTPLLERTRMRIASRSLARELLVGRELRPRYDDRYRAGGVRSKCTVIGCKVGRSRGNSFQQLGDFNKVKPVPLFT